MSKFQALAPGAASNLESVAIGAFLGACLGSAIPFLAWCGETIVRTPAEVLTHPSPALLVTAFCPVLAAAVGAWAYTGWAAQRTAREQLAAKAASLLEEAWELRGQVDEVRPARPGSPTPEIQETPAVSRPRRTPEDALVFVQARLLASFGDATRDAARRMHVGLQGLRLAGLNPIQDRMVDALHGHLEGLWDLADDVVAYAGDDAAPAQQVRPERPPRVAA